VSNLATKAPNFTLANAKEMAFRSVLARRSNSKREKAAYEAGFQAALNIKPADDEARKKTTLNQIDALDKRISEALDEDDEERFTALCYVKERLWKLVQPTMGTQRPPRKRDFQPPIEPITPAAAPQEPSSSGV
jgi:hypothetical protein